MPDVRLNQHMQPAVLARLIQLCGPARRQHSLHSTTKARVLCDLEQHQQALALLKCRCYCSALGMPSSMYLSPLRLRTPSITRCTNHSIRCVLLQDTRYVSLHAVPRSPSHHDTASSHRCGSSPCMHDYKERMHAHASLVYTAAHRTTVQHLPMGSSPAGSYGVGSHCPCFGSAERASTSRLRHGQGLPAGHAYDLSYNQARNSKPANLLTVPSHSKSSYAGHCMRYAGTCDSHIPTCSPPLVPSVMPAERPTHVHPLPACWLRCR